MEPELEHIKNMFSKMRASGWDTSGPLKWGFFFMGHEEEKLKQMYEELKAYGYKLESIHQADDGIWVLQASKTESLEPEKLFRRNISFNELAIAYDSLYDGWDAGPE